jgi:hypothetical protein
MPVRLPVPDLRLPRMTMRRWLVAVAVVALLSGWLGVAGALAWSGVVVLILGPLAFAFLAPFVLARPGPSLAVATWSASLYPALSAWCMYVAFVSARVALGHRPGVLDHGTFIQFLCLLTLFLLVTAPLATLTCLLFTALMFGGKIDLGGRPLWRLSPLLLAPLVWVFTVSIMTCDFLGAFEWFMD